jgi:ferric-dicitrate binding protein FerR (iron transport regulator)
MKFTDNSWNRLQRYFAGELPAEEMEEVDKWASESSANRNAFSDAKNIYQAFKDAELQKGKYNVDAAWEKYNHWMESEKIKTRSLKIRKLSYEMLKYAAILILAVSIGFGISNFFTDRQELAEFTIDVPKGHRSNVVLDDGTQVRLNSGSELRVYFNHDHGRKVELSGEGWFNVAHDPQRPFLVETERFLVEVLGTSFNVRSYPDDDVSHFYLSQGSVQLKNRRGENMILSPGQYVALSTDESFSVLASPGEQSLLAWMDGKYYFRNEALSEIAKLIERAYGLEVVFETPEIAGEKYTGSLYVDEHVSDLMNKLVLTSGFPMNYKLHDRKLIITTH